LLSFGYGGLLFMRTTLNERGQTAIFVAMIFQVLFVLFAMSINVGLVVHDKINLQNSVDLAAYYAAQKQAEILNAIGHSNYQIRQSWKLLAWRYRVLGTMGKDEHPVRKNITSDTLYPDTERPTTCVTYYPIWKGVAQGENLCRQSLINIPPLPNVPVIAPFLGINAVISALSISLINQYNGQCRRHGAYNWWFAASSMMAFRIDQSHRKRSIFGLAQNLSGGNPQDFLDINGNSVFAGVAKTLDKNLTFANKTSPGGVQIHLFNSLHNVRREEWLPEIQTIPTIIYTDVDNSSGCESKAVLVESLPQIAEARNYALNVLGGNEILPWVQSEPPTTHIMHMSMGVEKNPWFMAYVGVMAETRPRQIFFPFGPAISLKARAYAKPFGGRIGPWYHASWPRSSAVSVGPRTDPLAPPRTQQNGMLDSPSDITRLPNYSRFPGDQLGLRSGLALNGLKDLLALQTSFDEYKQTFRGMVPGAPNDPLAWDYEFDRVPPVRRYELSAIAPDLFDVTYYGIEPNFSANYFSHIFPNFSKFPFPPETLFRPDLGFRGGAINLYSVQDQMSDAAAFDKRRFDSFYFVREKAHLLTSWAPANQSLNFDFPENFGKCSLPDDDMTVKVPGSCAAGGGRTGYSVKLVSRDALHSGNHAIGGVAEPAGSILNPPPNQDGW
jgi:hypothetical protein